MLRILGKNKQITIQSIVGIVILVLSVGLSRGNIYAWAFILLVTTAAMSLAIILFLVNKFHPKNYLVILRNSFAYLSIIGMLSSLLFFALDKYDNYQKEMYLEQIVIDLEDYKINHNGYPLNIEEAVSDNAPFLLRGYQFYYSNEQDYVLRIYVGHLHTRLYSSFNKNWALYLYDDIPDSYWKIIDPSIFQ